MRDFTPADFAVDEIVHDPITVRDAKVVGRADPDRVRIRLDAVGGGYEPAIEVPATRIEKPQGRATYLAGE